MVENKVYSARLPLEVQEQIEAYRSVFGWDFGQIVTQLINYRARVMEATKRLDTVKNMQGVEVLLFWPDGETAPEDVDAERLAAWFIDESQKSVAEGFRSNAEWSAN